MVTGEAEPVSISREVQKNGDDVQVSWARWDAQG